MTRKASTYPGYGVKVRADVRGVCCIGRQGSAGHGKTREEAMVAYADRKMMTEEEFYDTGCAMEG